MTRRLGQHFLTDPRILDRVVDGIEPHHDDVVIEIGPGRGALTRRLIPRVKSVICIEKDQKLAEQLDADGIPGLRVVCRDALQEDWQALVGADHPFKIIGNVPYYISTPLIHQALSYRSARNIVFLLQKEVANRICAAPGTKEYGGLSIGVQSFAEPERLFAVAAGSFSPPPQVGSVTVRLTPRSATLVPFSEREPFRRFVTAVFGQRRKRMLRVLRNTMDLEVDAAREVLEGNGVDPDARPEMLAPESLAGVYIALPR